MDTIEISFPNIICNKCGKNAQNAILKHNRYGLYCRGCNEFIKWADHNQTMIINARKGWLKENG